VRLADFIVRDMERILAQWEAFAATCVPAAAAMESLALRDHAQQILEAVATDLSQSQSSEQQAAKSMGLAPAPFPARETAAQTHAVMRAKSGYDIKQLVSEYRALRASVLSLWLDDGVPRPPTSRTSSASARRSIRRSPNPSGISAPMWTRLAISSSECSATTCAVRCKPCR